MLIAGSQEFLLFTLVLMRMSGFILLNPMFGRQSIPNIFKLGLALLISFIVYPSVDNFETLHIHSSVIYGIYLLKEFLVGYVVSFIMYVFDMVATFAGFIIDMQMGLSMATVYDAESGAQIAVTGNILQIYYMLLFFAVDGHLALFRILMTSQYAVGYGAASIGPQLADALLLMFIQAVLLAIQLAMPILAFEFLMEIATGLLMRMIPQINIFVLSIQLRIIVGVMMLLFLISPMGQFLGDVIAQMVSSVENALGLMGTT